MTAFRARWWLLAALAWSATSAQLVPVSAAPADIPSVAVAVRDRLDVVVSVSVSGRGAEEISDEELDGLGFSPHEMALRGGGSPRRPLQATSGVASGFVISSNGSIVTNAHVVRDTRAARVRLHDGRSYAAQVIGLDRTTDVALLKIDASGLAVATIGDSSGLRQGDWVIAVGSPLGLDGTLTAGVVSTARRILPGNGGVPLIQSDLALNPGSSGGPLFNQRGEVIGINTLILTQGAGFMGISFSVPIESAMAVVDELAAHGRVRRGRLGAMIQELTDELAKAFGSPRSGAALVTRVQPRSAAERAGLRGGDILLGVDDRTDLRYEQLMELVGHTRVDTRLNLNVWRAGRMHRIAAVVHEAPADLPRRPAADEDRRAARLGLRLAELSEGRRRLLNVDSGLQVVQAGGPAAQGGVEADDIIVAVGSQAVRTLAEFDTALAAPRYGGPAVAVLVLRDGRYRYLAIATAE